MNLLGSFIVVQIIIMSQAQGTNKDNKALIPRARYPSNELQVTKPTTTVTEAAPKFVLSRDLPKLNNFPVRSIASTTTEVAPIKQSTSTIVPSQDLVNFNSFPSMLNSIASLDWKLQQSFGNQALDAFVSPPISQNIGNPFLGNYRQSHSAGALDALRNANLDQISTGFIEIGAHNMFDSFPPFARSPSSHGLDSLGQFSSNQKTVEPQAAPTEVNMFGISSGNSQRTFGHKYTTKTNNQVQLGNGRQRPNMQQDRLRHSKTSFNLGSTRSQPDIPNLSLMIHQPNSNIISKTQRATFGTPTSTANTNNLGYLQGISFGRPIEAASSNHHINPVTSMPSVTTERQPFTNQPRRVVKSQVPGVIRASNIFKHQKSSPTNNQPIINQRSVVSQRTGSSSHISSTVSPTQNIQNHPGLHRTGNTQIANHISKTAPTTANPLGQHTSNNVNQNINVAPSSKMQFNQPGQVSSYLSSGFGGGGPSSGLISNGPSGQPTLVNTANSGLLSNPPPVRNQPSSSSSSSIVSRTPQITNAKTHQNLSSTNSSTPSSVHSNTNIVSLSSFQVPGTNASLNIQTQSALPTPQTALQIALPNSQIVSPTQLQVPGNTASGIILQGSSTSGANVLLPTQQHTLGNVVSGPINTPNSNAIQPPFLNQQQVTANQAFPPNSNTLQPVTNSANAFSQPAFPSNIQLTNTPNLSNPNSLQNPSPQWHPPPGIQLIGSNSSPPNKQGLSPPSPIQTLPANTSPHPATQTHVFTNAPQANFASIGLQPAFPVSSAAHRPSPLSSVPGANSLQPLLPVGQAPQTNLASNGLQSGSLVSSAAQRPLSLSSAQGTNGLQPSLPGGRALQASVAANGLHVAVTVSSLAHRPLPTSSVQGTNAFPPPSQAPQVNLPANGLQHAFPVSSAVHSPLPPSGVQGTNSLQPSLPIGQAPQTNLASNGLQPAFPVSSLAHRALPPMSAQRTNALQTPLHISQAPQVNLPANGIQHNFPVSSAAHRPLPLSSVQGTNRLQPPMPVGQASHINLALNGLQPASSATPRQLTPPTQILPPNIHIHIHNSPSPQTNAVQSPLPATQAPPSIASQTLSSTVAPPLPSLTQPKGIPTTNASLSVNKGITQPTPSSIKQTLATATSQNKGQSSKPSTSSKTRKTSPITKRRKTPSRGMLSVDPNSPFSIEEGLIESGNLPTFFLQSITTGPNASTFDLNPQGSSGLLAGSGSSRRRQLSRTSGSGSNIDPTMSALNNAFSPDGSYSIVPYFNPLSSSVKNFRFTQAFF